MPSSQSWRGGLKTSRSNVSSRATAPWGTPAGITSTSPGVHDDVRSVVRELHPEAALEDVGELLVRVLMHGDDAALLQEDLREHGLLPGHDAPFDLVDQLLARNVLPAMERWLG